MGNDIHNRVQLVPWQEDWAKEYHLEKQCIIGILLDLCDAVEVYHVGSTSVKGMISKPIIDILVCLDDQISLEEAAERLEKFQYKNLGECGRPGRYFLTSGDEPEKTFYLHLCHKGHQVALEQLLFQQLERENNTIFEGYYQLKTELASLFPDNRMMYRELKGIYIESVLSAYRMVKSVYSGEGQDELEPGDTEEERTARRNRERERIRARLRSETDKEMGTDTLTSDLANPEERRLLEHLAAEAEAESRRKAERGMARPPKSVYVDMQNHMDAK